ncbi:class I SAM-dependent methyltransferase [Actinopolymorpha sp. NPDC004070]|uniref:class I SAM-dependent methyltransferase n=1 Tax=Actinopolymorpha sp. NPDC004070 TaxID=3154548 RepID=UPI0033BB2B3E
MDGPTTGDAFGELLRAAMEGRPSLGAIERDDGVLDPHDGRIYLGGIHEWSELDRIACARVVGKTLDVGCGAGRHSLHLQEKGFDVTGIDPSAGACEVSRARGVRKVRRTSVEDVPRLEERFDTFVLLGNNLALLGSPEHAPIVLDALAQVASPNAKVLGGSRDPYRTDAKLHLDYHAHNRKRGRPGGQTRIRSRFERLADPWFDYLFCSRDELVGLTKNSAWRLAEFDEDGAGYLAELRLR